MNSKFYSTLLYSTLLYSTLLYSTLLYSTLLYSTLLYTTLLYSKFLIAADFFSRYDGVVITNLESNFLQVETVNVKGIF